MKIDIRPAGPDDAQFLAWVMLTATRSHLNYGVWEHFVGGTEQDCLSFLNCIATTQQSHYLPMRNKELNLIVKKEILSSKRILAALA
jgi:hypothetical protein